MDVCKSANDTIIFIIFCIILFTLILSAIILLLNIVNYILFTVYCINDSVMDYTSENPDAIILEQKYKYRLLNYVKNTYDNNLMKPYTNKNNIDANASDLYISKTIIYYNYIVKMVLLIIFVILMGVLYNVFRIGVSVISQCDENVCHLIVAEILQKDTYIYYIIIIACIYAYVHSYIYTYFFNKNIYKELYGIYNDKYKKIDTVVSYSINYVNDKEKASEKDDTQRISKFIRDLKDLSYDTLEPLVKSEKAGESEIDASDASLPTIVNEGIVNNNKFVIPTELEEDEGNLNNIFKKIYKTPLSNIKNANDRELFAHKITIYLIYNYVISNNIEDPFIIHKLNNIYLNLFENLFEGKKDDPNYFLEKYGIDTANMFKQIRGAYTIKLLLPATTTKMQLTSKMNENALYIEKYIREYMKKPILAEQANTKHSIRKNKSMDGIVRNQMNADADKKAKTAIEKIDNNADISELMTKIRANIDTFADGFFDYYQEDKTPGDINRVVYKINLYLAIEMMETIIYIVLVLLILYNSGKYPYLEDYINMAITYAIAIINELISAILGII